MSDLEIFIGLVTAAGFSSYLYIKHQQKVPGRPELCDETEWTGKPIDVTKLKSTLEVVRLDYHSVRQPPKEVSFHTTLLGLARRAVARLAYFQNRESDGRQQSPGA